jgi:hypothetical protein
MTNDPPGSNAARDGETEVALALSILEGECAAGGPEASAIDRGDRASGAAFWGRSRTLRRQTPSRVGAGADQDALGGHALKTVQIGAFAGTDSAGSTPARSNSTCHPCTG